MKLHYFINSDYADDCIIELYLPTIRSGIVMYNWTEMVDGIMYSSTLSRLGELNYSTIVLK